MITYRQLLFSVLVTSLNGTKLAQNLFFFFLFLFDSQDLPISSWYFGSGGTQNIELSQSKDLANGTQEELQIYYCISRGNAFAVSRQKKRYWYLRVQLYTV